MGWEGTGGECSGLQKILKIDPAIWAARQNSKNTRMALSRAYASADEVQPSPLTQSTPIQNQTYRRVT